MMSRRTFLGISAGVAAAATAAYAVKWPKFDLSGASAEYVEGLGQEKWIATSCLNCPTRCAVNVRAVQVENDSTWRAVRILGNTRSSYSGGKTCPRSHVGLQVLYDPDRLTTPLKRNNTAKGRNVDPAWTEMTWQEALDAIADRLNGLSSPNKLLVLQGLNTTSDTDLISRLAKAYGTANLVSEDSMELDADREGKRLADGRNDSGYDLENANYVLAFGANIVESERPLARNLRMWGKIRRERATRARVVVVDPRYSVTAAKSDEWIPVNPGTEGALAMAMAGVIIDEGLYDTNFVSNWTTGFDSFKGLALSGDFSPETIAEKTGVGADVIRRIAREFAQAKPALAWSGPDATSWPHGSYASHAIYCLNALVGSIDVPGGILYQESPPYTDIAIAGSDPGIDFKTAAELIADGDVDAVIGFNSNLIMSAPNTSAWDNNLSNLPYYVHIAPSLTETAAYADIVLPACTYLEEWAYESALPGSGYAEARIKQPVVEPMYDSRPVAQIVFDLASQLGGAAANAFENIGNTPEGFVEHRTSAFVSWNTFKADGVWKGADYKYGKWATVFNTASGKFEFVSANLDKVNDIEFLGSHADYPLKLVVYDPVLNIRNGSQNYPWAQEMFLVMHGRGWDNFIEISAHTAHEMHIGDGDTVWVESDFGKVKAQAKLIEGILPGVLAIASGQGHYSSGQWADGMGVNPNDVIGTVYDEASGQPAFFSTRVRVYKA